MPSWTSALRAAFVLDALRGFDCIATMKMKLNLAAALIGAAILAAGCVNTVTGKKVAGVPFIKDTMPSRYERPIDKVFEAAKAVIKEDGVLLNEGILYGQTNLVKTVEGNVNQRQVFIRIEQEDAKVTSVSVQARTQNGGADLDLAHAVDKEIALKLVR